MIPWTGPIGGYLMFCGFTGLGRFIFLGVAALALVGPAHQALAAEYKVLHAFRGAKDGALPQAGLAVDDAGNLYGTTLGLNGTPGKHCPKSCGNVYGVLHDGGEQTIHSFRGPDGADPTARVLIFNGNLYGTTNFGGSGAKKCSGEGCGTVYGVGPDGTTTTLYSFCQRRHCADGSIPDAGVIADVTGNLYGTTLSGGKYGGGTVFKLTPEGVETVLYSFCRHPSCPDGAGPDAELIFDAIGNLFGTTESGGVAPDCPTGCGTVFKLAPDGTQTVLYSFCQLSSCGDGWLPVAPLIRDDAGNLYGTTAIGGYSLCNGGCGVVFKLAPDGTETVLHAFQGGIQYGNSDGASPAAGLVADKRGNLYGTTGSGGGATGCIPGYNFDCGTVFKLAPNGKITNLHAFCSEADCADGNSPLGTLILQGDELFGTASRGGRLDCGAGASYGCGTVFSVTRK